jgi:hypothetical protein
LNEVEQDRLKIAYYLRQRRSKAWRHTCCPQALAGRGNEISCRDHCDWSPGQQPTFRFLRGKELKIDGKKERRRRILRGGGSLVRELEAERVFGSD